MNGIIFANVSASVAVLLVLLLRKLFKEKLFAKVFVMLWLLIIIRLLLPFEFYSSLSVFAPEKEPVFEEVNQPVFIGNLPGGNEFISEKEENLPPIIPEKKKEASSKEILFGIWVFGAVLTVGFFSARHFYSVKRILKTSEPYDVLEIYKTGKTRFYKSKKLASPLSFGILRPVIVIPEETEETELHFVLLHENTHIKDRDAVLKTLALFALSLNWFNPLVWFMVKIFERDIERYCDERVLKKIGAEKALFYANTILDFAERESLSLNYFSAASLCERVTSIMKTKHKKQNILVSALVLVAVLLTITACGTLPEKEEKEPEVSLENRELLELIENAEWIKSGSDSEYISIENGKFGDAVITKLAGEDDFQYYWNFSNLPVEQIIIKDLGFSDNSGVIYCLDSRNNAVGDVVVRNYKNLLEKGFKIEYEEGKIIVSSEKPLLNLEGAFSIDFFVDLDNIEIVSETHEVKYMMVEAGVESEPAIKAETEKSAEEIAKEIGYMTLEEITAAGYYPDWMQPYTKIVYDENKVPKITEGGELLPEDLVGRPEFTTGEPMLFTSVGIEDPFFMIQPNTMAEYDLHGFIQNIYYLWPDGNYNLSPPPETVAPEELIKVPEFLWPCEEKDLNAVVGSYNGHTGIDIGHTQGAKIYASRAGVVTETEWGNTGYGYYIVIDHGEGYLTLYAHCSEIFVKKGQRVEAGETIGLIGSTGNSTGTHLHFELRYKGGIIDPQNLLVKN